MPTLTGGLYHQHQYRLKQVVTSKMLRVSEQALFVKIDIVW